MAIEKLRPEETIREYNFLGAEAAPSREMRIGACNIFGGTCGALKGRGCSKNADRAYNQAQGCQLGLALGILNAIENVVIIIHAPLGCGAGFLGSSGVFRMIRTMKNASLFENIWISTNLTQTEVIGGGLAKLESAVLYAEREFRPEAIVVANSCVPALIGDDIDTLLNNLSRQTSAVLIPVHCEGFKSKLVASGYDAAYHGLLKKLVDPPAEYPRVLPDDIKDAKEKYRIAKTVNIINVSSASVQDENELTRLLKALDLNVNVLPQHASIEEISRISEAAVNLSMCPTHDDYLTGHLKERFGTDYTIETIPVGLKNTARILRHVGGLLGLEEAVERLIESEEAAFYAAVEPYRDAINGLRLFVGGGETRVLATAEQFQALGAHIIAMKPHHFDIFAEPLLADITPDTIIDVAPGQPSEEMNLLARHRPDLYIGHLGAMVWPLKLGIPTMPLFGNTINYMGYTGAFEMIRRAVRILKNPGFAKKVYANVGQPLRKSWYEKDPFYYIREEGDRA
ncbi:MAG: nitrogenase [Clostridiales Family XIII bacterium]|jgi:nitrogenase molybdenum-iron protein alpha chain|nr:nitrogenase [Clostridiales Family XIII bacterium]